MEKKTKQKEAILKALRGSRSHPTVDWIYNQVRKEVPNISLATVYRNLKLLKERGEILELDISGTVSRYDAYTDNHYHFRCDKCDSVFDVGETINKEIDKKVARDMGFLVNQHRLEFRGLCRDCQKNRLVDK